MKNEVKEKTRENRGEKPRHREFRTILPPGAKFAPPYPLVGNCLCEHFPESMLSVPTQNLSAKMHRNANIVRNSDNTIPLVRNSHHHIHLCEICITPFRKLLDTFRSLPEVHFMHTISRFQSLGSQESIASNGARFGVETKKLWLFEDDYAKMNGNAVAAPHFATVGHIFGALYGAQIMHTIFHFEA